MIRNKQTRNFVSVFPSLIIGLLLFSGMVYANDQRFQQEESAANVDGMLGGASKFAEKILGKRMRKHFTDYKRGNVGMDAFFESENAIGYTTFSNELYEKVSSPVELKDCVLFVAKFKTEDVAEQLFNQLKTESRTRASEVEGLVGITPVRVRFMEKIRSDGNGGLFTQKGNYVFFLVENGEKPPATDNWNDYEKTFLEAISDEEDTLETIQLRQEK